MLRPIAASQVPCKCCGGPAQLYGVVDFNKNCQNNDRNVLICSGVPIYYHRCSQCQFLFTTAFDHFTHEDFARWIYNDQYALVDPDYREVRPRASATLLENLLGKARPHRLLDFGCGNGTLATALRAAGFAEVDCYDPFVPAYSTKPSHRYDCIVSFEVAEHSTDPIRTFSEMNEFLADPGLIIFSTLVQSPDIDRQGLNWWYAGPRNGHASLYSQQSLAKVLGRFGLQLGSCNPSLHIAFRNLPEFARSFVRVAH
jgi:2-polyprenyl-6-hydroxyphenyl methylase/3-demethylubiquinone-9 3-methyltransferase